MKGRCEDENHGRTRKTRFLYDWLSSYRKAFVGVGYGRESGDHFVGRPANQARWRAGRQLHVQQSAGAAGLSGRQRPAAPARGAGRPAVGGDARRGRGQQPAPGVEQSAQALRPLAADHPRHSGLQPRCAPFSGHDSLCRPAASQQRPASRPARRTAAPGAGALPRGFPPRLLRARRARLRGLGAGGAGAAARSGAERPGHADTAAAGER